MKNRKNRSGSTLIETLINAESKFSVNQRRYQRISASTGFTYIELLITLAIIAVLFVPIMQLFSHSLYSSSVSKDLITATNLAKWQMEKIKNLGYTKEQLRKNGDIIYPPVGEGPMELNNMKWRIKSNILKESDPLEVRVSVYPVRTKILEGSEIEVEEEPLVTLVTLIEDMFWEEAVPIK